MDPWNIIGWAVIGTGIAWTLWQLFRRPLAACFLVLAHYITRRVKPERGQVWVQDFDLNNRIRVVDVLSDSVVLVLDLGRTAKSWTESKESWQARIQKRRLILLDMRK